MKDLLTRVRKLESALDLLPNHVEKLSPQEYDNLVAGTRELQRDILAIVSKYTPSEVKEAV